MATRNHLPERWLFTDERLGAALWTALGSLQPGSGVVFRHYDAPQRADIFRRVRSIAARRGLLLSVARPEALGWRGWAHANQHALPANVLTASAHGRADLYRAARAGAALAFLSPVFETASHPGAHALGAVRFGLLARNAPLAVGALGGMTEGRFEMLKPLGARAWGAISALS